MADNPTGITVAFGTSTFTAAITGISVSGMERGAIDVTHLGSTTFKDYIPATLSDPGQVEATFLADPDQPAPIGAAVETLTVTFPIPSGGSTGATLVGTGFITSWDLDASGGDDSAMSGTFTFKFDGGTGPTWTDHT